jgi:phosphoserine phosphatase RsbU/P
LSSNLQLREALRRRLAPAASSAGIGLSLECPGMAAEWLSPCVASVIQGSGSSSSLNGTNSTNTRVIRFASESQSDSRLVLHLPDEGSDAWCDCLETLANSAIEVLEVADREDLLLQELGASWESLAALYDGNLDLQSKDSLHTVLDRLLDRAIVAGSEVAAILWVLDESVFRVVAERRCAKPDPRDGSGGLFGAARNRAAPMVLDGTSDELIDRDALPELREAGPIVLIPVRTRQGFEALLQVWGMSDSPPFESPAVRLLEAIGIQAANAIENDRLYRAALEGERMQQEMAIGAGIQQHLLLGEAPQGLSGIEISSHMIPSLEVGGDFYQFIRHSATCFDAIVGDVMGKGIPAALMGAATKNNVLRVIAESKGGAGNMLQPAEIVTAVNQVMCGQLMQLSSFVTLLYARIDLRTNTLTYVDAGHAETLHYAAKTCSTDFLLGEGCPLGFIDAEKYTQSVVPLDPNDIVLIYSDGVSEAADGNGPMYGTDRILRVVKQNAAESAAAIASKLIDDVIAFKGSCELADDLTCLVIKIAEEKEACSPSYLQLAGNLDELEELRNWLKQTLCAHAPFPLDSERIFAVQLAVQEAATNVINYAGAADSSQGIRVELRMERTKAYIKLIYAGAPFSPENVPLPSFDGSRDHGFGVYLIDQLMDEVTYACVDGQNTILLMKDLEPGVNKEE